MGFFSKIFKGIKKVVKGIGKVIKKVVKSRAFRVIAAVALAVVSPGIAATVMQGLSTAGAWAANTIATGAQMAWSAARAVGTGIKTFGKTVFKSVTETISNGVDFMKSKLGFKQNKFAVDSVEATSKSIEGLNQKLIRDDLFVKAVEKQGLTAVTTPTPGHIMTTGLRPSELKAGQMFGRSAEQIAIDQTKNVMSSSEILKEAGKKTLGEKTVESAKKYLVDPLVEGFKQDAQSKVKETILDKIAGERKEASLVGTRSYAKSVGDYDSSQGYAPLMSLSTNPQNPYLSYSQGQQLFGAPQPTAG
jgi:hypothetical protein